MLEGIYTRLGQHSHVIFLCDSVQIGEEDEYFMPRTIIHQPQATRLADAKEMRSRHVGNHLETPYQGMSIFSRYVHTSSNASFRYIAYKLDVIVIHNPTSSIMFRHQRKSVFVQDYYDMDSLPSFAIDLPLAVPPCGLSSFRKASVSRQTFDLYNCDIRCH